LFILKPHMLFLRFSRMVVTTKLRSHGNAHSTW